MVILTRRSQCHLECLKWRICFAILSKYIDTPAISSRVSRFRQRRAKMIEHIVRRRYKGCPGERGGGGRKTLRRYHPGRKAVLQRDSRREVRLSLGTVVDIMIVRAVIWARCLSLKNRVFRDTPITASVDLQLMRDANVRIMLIGLS